MGTAKICTLLLNKIMPPMRDLWNFYMVATNGPGQALHPGAAKSTGEHLFSRIQAVEKVLADSGGRDTTMWMLEQQIQTLEPWASAGGGAEMPSVFGTGLHL
jgi:hypothetical protein